jgi:hypothetical protein
MIVIGYSADNFISLTMWSFLGLKNVMNRIHRKLPVWGDVICADRF